MLCDQPITVKISNRGKRSVNNTRNVNNRMVSIQIPVRITERNNEHNYNKKHISRAENLIYINKNNPVISPPVRPLLNVLIVKSRSFVGKVNELEYYANIHKIEIIVVTETWLSDVVPTEVVSIFRFALVRKDRKSAVWRGLRNLRLSRNFSENSQRLV